MVPPLEIGEPVLDFQSTTAGRNAVMVIDVRPPLSSFHYHATSVSLAVRAYESCERLHIYYLALEIAVL